MGQTESTASAQETLELAKKVQALADNKRVTEQFHRYELYFAFIKWQDDYLDRIVRDAVFMAQCARRKTISKKDVLDALSRHNRKLYQQMHCS